MKDTDTDIEQLAAQTIERIGKSRSPRKREKLLELFCSKYLKEIRSKKHLSKLQKGR